MLNKRLNSTHFSYQNYERLWFGALSKIMLPPFIPDFKSVSNWQCTKGEDKIFWKRRLNSCHLYPSPCMCCCFTSARSLGKGDGGTRGEMAKRVQTSWLLPGAPGSKCTVPHRVRHLGSLPTTPINLFPPACAGLNQREETAREHRGGHCNPLGQLLFLGRHNHRAKLRLHSDHQLTKKRSALQSLTQGAPLQLSKKKKKSFLSHTLWPTHASKAHGSLSTFKYPL